MVYGTNTAALSESEDFLANCEPVHVIPSYASVNEMMYYVIESSEQDYNNFMMNIGITELNHLEESGYEMVYEDANKENIVEKAQNLFKTMWTKVQGFIQDALDKLAKKADDLRSKVLNKLDKKFIAKRKAGLKDDKNFGTTYEKYLKFEDLSAAGKGYFDKIGKQREEVNKAYQDITTSKSTGDAEAIAALEKRCESAVKYAMQAVSGSADVSISSMANNIKEELRGKSTPCTGAWVKSNFDTIIKEASTFNNTKRDLKREYNTLRKLFNDAIATCKKANNEHFKANAFTKTIKAYKQLCQIATTTEQAVISCHNERHAFFRSVILKVLGSKPVKESYSESSTVDAIDSLFNW